MRAGELIGRPVVDHAGRRVGVCTDLRCSVMDGPADSAPEIVLRGLLVSPRRVGSLLGYERGRTVGPALIGVLVRRLHRGMFFVSWEDVLPVTGGVIRLRPGDRRLALREGSGA